MRQVQTHEAPRRDLRQMRRGGHAVESPARAPRPHRARVPGVARVVLQGTPEPHRTPTRRVAPRSRTSALFRVLRRDRSRRDAAQGKRAPLRGALPRDAAGVQEQVHCRDGCRSDQGASAAHRGRRALRSPARGDENRDLAAEKTQVRKALEGRRSFPQVEQPARVDDLGCHSGDPARAQAFGSSRRWSFRHQRSKRSLSPGHQPQQSVEKAHGAQSARRYRS